MLESARRLERSKLLISQALVLKGNTTHKERKANALGTAAHIPVGHLELGEAGTREVLLHSQNEQTPDCTDLGAGLAPASASLESAVRFSTLALICRQDGRARPRQHKHIARTVKNDREKAALHKPTKTRE